MNQVDGHRFVLIEVADLALGRNILLVFHGMLKERRRPRQRGQRLLARFDMSSGTIFRISGLVSRCFKEFSNLAIVGAITDT